jgi:oxygen-independent coproporphyrinogen-3 oxidase
MTAPQPEGAQAPRTTAELLARYDRPGPRYTSYPTAVSFHEGVGEAEYRDRLARADVLSAEPLSLYAHLPFCQERCLYCGCNVIITPHMSVAAPYLTQIVKELDLLAGHLPHRRKVSQMHWGGGTPTYYTPAQMVALFKAITERFEFTADAEIGVEVDPRVTTFEHLDALTALGLNRLSAGVQDFDLAVQKAVHRVQSFDDTKALVEHARKRGIRSTNLDLIFGLPYQTLASFRTTLERVLDIRPERLAVYSFAFVPWIKGHMKHLPPESLPGPELKLDLLALAIEVFTGAGYRAIGMDHFALPDDELALAADKGTLSRNFMGYTVQSARDMVAVGISSIGDVQGAFVQNVKKISTYNAALDAGRFPVERGYVLSEDDERRRAIITEIMCNARLDTAAIERRFGLDFAATFAEEMKELSAPGGLVDDGLVELSPGSIRLTPPGRRFVRNVAMVFDRHLREAKGGDRPVFSRTV